MANRPKHIIRTEGDICFVLHKACVPGLWSYPKIRGLSRLYDMSTKSQKNLKNKLIAPTQKPKKMTNELLKVYETIRILAHEPKNELIAPRTRGKVLKW